MWVDGEQNAVKFKISQIRKLKANEGVAILNKYKSAMAVTPK